MPRIAVGVTLWKLRRAKTGEPGPRFRLLEPGERDIVDWVAERADIAEPLERGSRVRLAIESPQPGYLYVVNREEYSTGRRSRPHLIFPTYRIHRGSNELTPGRIIELPGIADTPPYFRVDAAVSSDITVYQGELITIIVTPKPLDLEIDAGPLLLTENQVSTWESRWGRTTRRLSLAGGVGRARTQEENEAADLRERLLTHDDPSPQEIYLVSAKPAEPFVIRLPLKLSMPSSEARENQKR
jgi:hypothetical protein